MVEALTLPGVEAGVWQHRSRSDPAALALARNHYSRQRPDSNCLGPPGAVCCFVTPCERAVWVTHHPLFQYVKDGLDAYRCSMFRNEGAGLSSELIRTAVELTEHTWGAAPADGWVTYVIPKAVESPNPGYCFKQAGWTLDRDYRPWRPGLIRLRLA